MGSYFLSSSALHPITNMKFLVAAARADHLATKFGAGLGYAGYAPGYAAGYGYAGLGYAGLGYAAPVATGYAGYGAGYGYAAAAPVVATARAAHLDTQAAEYAASAPVIAAAPAVAAVP